MYVAGFSSEIQHSQNVIICERKEKEILYGAEVSLQLRALLREEYSFFDIYNEFVEEYGKINFEFVKQNGRIHRILNKETFIL